MDRKPINWAAEHNYALRPPYTRDLKGYLQHSCKLAQQYQQFKEVHDELCACTLWLQGHYI